MNREDLKVVYQKLIIPESENAYHFENLGSVYDFRAENPICGDRFDIKLDENQNIVQKAQFDGKGCALSKASTSLLMRAIEGKPREKAQQICKDFLKAFESGDPEMTENSGLKILIELKNFGGREDCIKLSWDSLYEYLNEK